MISSPLLADHSKNVARLLKDQSELSWIRRGERQALRLFHAMAKRVPAYIDFLRKHKIKPERVTSLQVFRELPTLDKNNYLCQYPLSALCWDGKFVQGQYTISTTSGSTGEPFYFPRTDEQIQQYALVAELYLRENFHIHRRSTLYIDAFPMGPWIGGVFTYETIRLVAERGKFPLSIITTGINKQDIIRAVIKFGKEFDQILIGCYGPFLKDALDEGTEQGIVWSKYNLGFIFSAEGFTEEFRDYVVRSTRLANPYTTTLNHYGTVDLGTMAHETPVTILLRRLTVRSPKLLSVLFGDTVKLPTLCQYIPELFYFEEVNRGLVCSANSGLPLVRYDLKDQGGVATLQETITRLKEQGVTLKKELSIAEITSTVWNLPLVYVFERSDFSVSLYAFQIYPETIRRALAKHSFEKTVTGKFTLQVKFNRAQNQYLEVNVELRRGIKPSTTLILRLQKSMMVWLRSENAEYAKTYSEIPERVTPQIVLWPYEDTRHFRPGIKQKWVKK